MWAMTLQRRAGAEVADTVLLHHRPRGLDFPPEADAARKLRMWDWSMGLRVEGQGSRVKDGGVAADLRGVPEAAGDWARILGDGEGGSLFGKSEGPEPRMVPTGTFRDGDLGHYSASDS